jgi:hypothetical protein
MAALTFGALAMVTVAVMVVAMTPRSSPGESLLSATTAPFTSTASTAVEAPVRTVRAEPLTRSVETLPTVPAPRIPVTALLTSFTSFPHAITSTPQLTLDGTEVAAEVPADGDLVFVHTEAVTYRLPWAQVAALAPPDGSMVFDADNSVVAVIDDGQLLTVAGD